MRSGAKDAPSPVTGIHTVEPTPIASAPTPRPTRFERTATLLGLVTGLLVLLIGLGLYLVKFQVDRTVVYGSFAAIAVLTIATSTVLRPASSLTPAERTARTNRFNAVFLGLLTGLAILGAIASAAELDTAQDWFMLGVIVSSPIGAYFVVYTRFGIQ